MISKTKVLATALAVALAGTAIGCDTNEPRRVDRWATTENTNVQLNLDKVNQAYREASGPEDFEKRVNEIYEGDEVISIAVADQDNKTQVVTGFFDKNSNGSVDEGEKIFTIKREPTGENTAQYQTQGYGPYSGYYSPMFSIASGMMMGAMLSHMFSPSYVPVHYVTSSARMRDLHTQRTSFRAQNPERFGPRSKSTGRSYGGRPTSRPSSPGRMGGGGRFGLARNGRTARPVRLTA